MTQYKVRNKGWHTYKSAALGRKREKERKKRIRNKETKRVLDLESPYLFVFIASLVNFPKMRTVQFTFFVSPVSILIWTWNTVSLSFKKTSGLGVRGFSPNTYNHHF